MKEAGAWYVYILLCGDGTLYTGITNDLKKRLAAHKAGTGARYTAQRGAKKIIYSEICASRSAASKREYQIKKMSRSAKLKLI